MVSLKAKKRLTYFTIGSFFFMGGIEYAVILPSVWLYIHTTFKAQEYFLGLMLSAFCVSGLFSGPIMGRWADKTRQVRLILMVAAVFEMVGSFMYFMGYSVWFLVGSRLVAGCGVGGEAVILAEIARFTTEEERTGVISILIAVRQAGLLLGPGLNFFLSRIDFYIGPFHVDKFTSPGLLMTLIWFLMEIFLITLFTNPEKLFSTMRVMEHAETTYTAIQNSDDDDQYAAIPSSMPPVTYDDVYPEITQTTQTDDLNTPVAIQKGMVNSVSANMAGSTGNSSVMNMSVGSAGSIDSSVSIGNSTHLIESAEIIIQTDSSGSNGKSKLMNRENSQKKKRKGLLNSRSNSSDSRNSHRETEDPVSVGKLRFFYNEYIREEIVTLLGLQFITIFTQVALETMLTPLTDKLLHWDEFDNSLLYCGAGVEIILMFLVTRWLSQRLADRYMLMIGGFVLTVSTAWMTYFLPTCTVDTPMRTLAGFIAGVFLDMVALPFLMVCGVSLYSKLTRRETQGLSQGIRRSVAGVGTILAPLWAGSTIPMPYVMLGVILGLLVISQVMLLMSFSQLKAPKENTPPSDNVIADREARDSERRPLLGQIS